MINDAVATLDGICSELGSCYAKLGVMTAWVRPDGEGVSIIYPKGYEQQTALMLYQAADCMVSRIPNTATKH